MIQPIKFNLFWTIRLKPRPDATEFLKRYTRDDQGYIHIKVWQFIETFGPSLRYGRSPMFEEIMYLVPPENYTETDIITVRF